jgi:hypothetical protein
VGAVLRVESGGEAQRDGALEVGAAEVSVEIITPKEIQDLKCSIAFTGTIEKPVFATIDTGLHTRSHGRRGRCFCEGDCAAGKNEGEDDGNVGDGSS